MPFKSKKQQRFMFSKMPELAKEFAEKTDFSKLPEKAKKKKSSYIDQLYSFATIFCNSSNSEK